MTIIDTTQQSPLSTSLVTSFTPFSAADISCDIARETVTAKGDTDLTTASSGWTRINQVKARTGNIQGIIIHATQATFEKTTPGTSETLVVDSSAASTFAGSLSRITA
ncbi:MAG TPA: hypothetical protein VMS43_14160 [Allosphingosinicella sp.]|nr:hypothetical protein [Allosphingosinicella sp.]